MGRSKGRRGSLKQRIGDYWIYALIAHDGDSTACYVGQSINLSRRMREHLKRRYDGVCSSEVFEWADEHDVPVRVVILAYAENAFDAACLEASWLRGAQAAGLHTPGVERWGVFPAKVEQSVVQVGWSEIVFDELPIIGSSSMMRLIETAPHEPESFDSRQLR